jgi:DNA-directed RNA polymerase specialized sigma24 family protein
MPQSASVVPVCPSVSNSQARPQASHADGEVEAVVARIIGAKARRLIGRRGLRYGDYKDLVQELTLEWLRYRPSFDPARAQLCTYATRVVENRIAHLMRHRAAAKRGADRPVASLSRLVKDPADGWVQEGSRISEDNLPGGAGSADREDQRDLRVDVAAMVASLPVHLRDLCQHLQTMTITDYALWRGIPRSTLYATIAELRQQFTAAGLGDYLPTRSDCPAQND